MAKGELENRDRDEGMGDLPYPLALERGEAGTMHDPYSRVPADMRRNEQSRAQADTVGLGTPQLDYNVRAVFDSRPVNGVDFLVTAVCQFTFDSCGGILIDTDNAQLFQVPAGRVAVIRKVSFGEITSDAGGGTFVVTNTAYATMVQLCKNAGVILPIDMTPANPPAATYKNAMPINGGSHFETFQIYDEFETFGLNFLVYSTAALDDGTYYMPVQFYGNMILKTGAPSQFEVANSGPGKPAVAAASSADIFGGIPPAARRLLGR